MQTNNDQIGCMTNQAITNQIVDYFKTQPVVKVWLFGSPSRVEFEAKAKAWYYAELLRDERKRQERHFRVLPTLLSP